MIRPSKRLLSLAWYKAVQNSNQQSKKQSTHANNMGAFYVDAHTYVHIFKHVWIIQLHN